MAPRATPLRHSPDHESAFLKIRNRSEVEGNSVYRLGINDTAIVCSIDALNPAVGHSHELSALNHGLILPRESQAKEPKLLSWQNRMA
jgi:hypothetical protein